MNNIHNKHLTETSRELRRNMTPEERHLWYDFLKKIPCTFHRQKIMGRYVVDFYCASAKLVIELDGAQHYEPEAREKDIERDEWLNSRGIAVLRYTNKQVNKQFAGVCENILQHIHARIATEGDETPHPSTLLPPSPQGEG